MNINNQYNSMNRCISFRINSDNLDYIKIVARENKISLSAFCRELLIRYTVNYDPANRVFDLL
jgi:hypothetical protein